MSQKQLFKTGPVTPEDLKKRIKVTKAVTDSAYKIVASFDAAEYPFSDEKVEAVAALLAEKIREIFRPAEQEESQ